nr:lycopene beta-cyclase CrtY [Acuticoccus kalidii]
MQSPQRLLIAGGGLAGTLIATAFAARRPDVAITLAESGDRLGGNHTWSAFGTDFGPRERALIDPFVSHRWDGYDCRFTGGAFTYSTPYLSIASDDLDRVARHRLGDAVRLDTPVTALDAAGAVLADGSRIEADAVIDARGPRQLAGVTLRWQKFLGREVRLADPHGLTQPTIMDAAVPQLDGYRFVYLLPFGPDRLLIEDTYYAEDPAVDAAVLTERIDAYAAARGWTIRAEERVEVGALPLLLAGDLPTLWREATAEGAVPVGLRAGLFHPVTGYSLPLAARTATRLAELAGPVTTARLMAAVEGIARDHFARSAFDRMLNRLLFLAGPPERRHLVLQRFHGLPQPLIERFYAGALKRSDQARILAGKPPVPLLAALGALPERAALRSG